MDQIISEIHRQSTSPYFLLQKNNHNEVFKLDLTTTNINHYKFTNTQINSTFLLNSPANVKSFQNQFNTNKIKIQKFSIKESLTQRKTYVRVKVAIDRHIEEREEESFVESCSTMEELGERRARQTEE